MIAYVKTIWRLWKALGRRIGSVVVRLVLVAVYFVLAAPLGYGARWFSDPLRLRHTAAPTWLPREPRGTDAAEFRRQF